MVDCAHIIPKRTLLTVASITTLAGSIINDELRLLFSRLRPRRETFAVIDIPERASLTEKRLLIQLFRPGRNRETERVVVVRDGLGFFRVFRPRTSAHAP